MGKLTEEQKSRKRAFYQANKEKVKEQQAKYRAANYEKIKERDDKYRKCYVQEHRDRMKVYYRENREARSDYNKDYHKKNAEKINQRRKERRENDKNYALRVNLRNRLNAALYNKQKAGSAVRDLGCSVEEFVKYIESKSHERMTWDNWGRKGWHLDHIKPLAAFDLTDRQQFLEACHYTNMQPMWWNENLAKGVSWSTSLAGTVERSSI